MSEWTYSTSMRAEMLKSPMKWTIVLMIVFISFFLLAILWANRAELDEVTTGVGQVVPSSKVQVVQNYEGGIISEILVKEGESVKKGQMLLRIDDTRVSSSFRENYARYLGYLASSTRLNAEVQGKDAINFPEVLTKERPELVKSELDLFKSRKAELNNAISILKDQEEQRKKEVSELESRIVHIKQSYQLALKEAKILEPLVKQQVASEVELLRLQREVNDLKGNLESTTLNMAKAKSALQESENRINERKNRFRAEALTQLNDINSKQLAIKETLKAAEDRVTRTDVRSPMAGIVQRILVTTIGQTVQPGEDMVEIIPLEDSLLVEARIQPQDIAFLSPGQKATVKVTAYDFLIYGGLPASLEQISPDSLVDENGNRYFRIFLKTERNYLESIKKGRLPIKPGMVVEVDILTGEKTVMDYLLKPINRARHKAFRER